MECKVISYMRTYTMMDLKLFKLTPKVYEIAKIAAMIAELKRGFKMIRCNKPTKKGTSIKFVTIIDPKDVEIELQKLQDSIKTLNNSVEEEPTCGYQKK
jgi:hypothetical protein